MTANALQQMLGGPLATGLVYTAIELDLPERLAAHPATAADLAATSGADPGAVHRILRGLAGLGIVAPDGDRVALTPMGNLLRAGVPDSAYHSTRLMGHPAIQRAWGSLPHTARTGEPAFDHANGIDFMACLVADPDFGDRFNRFMSEVTERVAPTVVRAVAGRHDLDTAKTIVDVGGGAGALLRAVLLAHPHAYGTVVDVEVVRAQAETAIRADGLDGRCAFVAGDFFGELPAGADVYLLKSVLHDWDDDRALTILGNCRDAMGPHSRLLVVEREVDDAGAVPFDIVMSDLIMLTMGPGRERTVAEYGSLFDRAGLRLTSLTATGAGPSVLEVNKR